jgi:nitrous oxidase accessory protein
MRTGPRADQRATRAWALLLALLGLAALALQAFLAVEAPAQAWGAAVPRNSYQEAGDARGLQLLIDFATPGGILRLPPGDYSGRLSIGARGLRIDAREVRLYGSGGGSTVEIRADGVELSGLEVYGSGDRLRDFDAGIAVIGAKGTRISGCRVSGALFGVYAKDCSGLAVVDCELGGRAELPFARRGDAIRARDSLGIGVSKCLLTAFCDGLYLDSSHLALLAQSRIEGGRYALHAMYSSHFLAAGNLLERNVIGAMLMKSSEGALLGNEIRRNLDPRGTGITIYESTALLVSANGILGNATGIEMRKARRCLITGNRLWGNGMGARDSGAQEESHFSGNSFVGNLAQTGGLGGSQAGLWALGGRGNHWDDYQGLDLNGDGIGDSPSLSDAFFPALVENVPELRVFFGSPLFHVMTRAWPTARPVDPFPLMILPK